MMEQSQILPAKFVIILVDSEMKEIWFLLRIVNFLYRSLTDFSIRLYHLGNLQTVINNNTWKLTLNICTRHPEKISGISFLNSSCCFWLSSADCLLKIGVKNL